MIDNMLRGNFVSGQGGRFRSPKASWGDGDGDDHESSRNLRVHRPRVLQNESSHHTKRRLWVMMITAPNHAIPRQHNIICMTIIIRRFMWCMTNIGYHRNESCVVWQSRHIMFNALHDNILIPYDLISTHHVMFLCLRCKVTLVHEVMLVCLAIHICIQAIKCWWGWGWGWGFAVLGWCY